MRTIVKGKNLEVPERVRRYAERKLARLERLRLVVPAVAGSGHVDRHVGDEVAARGGRPPALSHGPAERLGQSPLAGVLQVVQRPPDRPAERRTPFELEERFRDV